MSKLFKPYEGKRPYLFISYPHKQSDAVVDTIRILHDKKYRLWYDEGIPAGSDWPANIAQHLRDSQGVICFISDHFLKSPNCFSEIRAAVQLGKPILVLYLEDVVPEGEWKKLLDGRKTIPVLSSPQERAQAILGASFIRRRFRRKWRERIPWKMMGFAASLILFLASAVAFGGVVTGQWSAPQQAEIPEPTEVQREEAPPVTVDLGEAEKFFAVKFPDAQQEKAVRDAVGIAEENLMAEDLIQIQKLYFCGNLVMKNANGVSFDEEGNCFVNSAPVLQGSVSNLSLIEKLVYLEELALVYQPVSNLSGLSKLVLLRELNLAGSNVSSVKALQEMPSLEILHLEHTAVTDLRPLEQLPRLKTVTVSEDMLPLTWTQNAQFEVVLTK